MSDNKKLSAIIISLLIIFSLLFPLNALHACNGKDVVLSDNAILQNQNGSYNSIDSEGNLEVHESEVFITPELANAIAEKFVTDNIENPPLPLTFRKFEYVHNKLVYQFESQPLENYNGKYHLGPVNFAVENS